MPRIGLDFALDSLGGGLGGSILCDFSTYFNGLLNVNVDFIQRAPLHIDTVGVTNDAVTADVAFDFEVDEEFTITFRLTEQTANDKLFVIYDTGTTIEISLVVDTGTYFPTIEIFNGASTVVCDGNANLVLGQQYTIGFRTSGAITTKLFEMLIDGVAQTDTELVNVTGGTADKVYIGTSVALTDVTKMELFSQSSVQLGNVNFVSNASDGLNFNSTNGDTYIASDQTPLTIQYPNYPPVSGDIVSSPATGPMRFASVTPANSITADIVYDPNIDDLFTSGIDYLVDFVQFNDTFFKIYNSANTDQFINVFYTYSGANRILRVQAKDGVTVFTTQLLNEMIAGTKSDIGFDSAGIGSAKTIRAYSDGVYATDGKVINWTGITFDKIIYGVSETMSGDSFPMDLYDSNSTQLEYTNFTTRLPTKESASTITRNGIVYTVDGPEFYPYYGEFTPIKVAMMGDSITAAYTYPEKLETAITAIYPNAVFTKYAVSGHDSFDLAPVGFDYASYTGGHAPDLVNNIDKVLADDNDIIILLVGVNNYLTGMSQASVTDVYAAIIAKAEAAGKRVIPVTLMSALSSQVAHNTFVNEVSDSIRSDFNNVADISATMGLGGPDNFVDFPNMSTDGAHPTEPLGAQTQSDTIEPLVLNLIEADDWDSPYLESDTQCPDNDLVTNNNIAVTNNGEFVFNTP